MWTRRWLTSTQLVPVCGNFPIYDSVEITMHRSTHCHLALRRFQKLRCSKHRNKCSRAEFTLNNVPSLGSVFFYHLLPLDIPIGTYLSSFFAFGAHYSGFPNNFNALWHFVGRICDMFFPLNYIRTRGFRTKQKSLMKISAEIPAKSSTPPPPRVS